MTLHLPAETAMALAMAMTDTRCDLYAMRTAAEAAIEDLLQFLDDSDGDPDLEPNGDEHDSSWPAVGSHAFGTSLDEDDEASDHDEDGGDDEPSLGSLDSRPHAEAFGFMGSTSLWANHTAGMRVLEGSQSNWSAGRGGDLEDEHDGAEPDVSDAEHSLGRPDHLIDQTEFTGFGHEDAEAVDEDGGDINDQPQDWDELEDQHGCHAVQLADGTIVNDREESGCGNGVCDDHGIADVDGATEQGFGAFMGMGSAA